tara:strand:- start:2006 stop:2239 length:234 start_codon:yes stop_codon:yes gene_type:complete
MDTYVETCMYCEKNYKTKKSLKEALANGIDVYVFQPGTFPPARNGLITLEGPHYPKPHTWYASCEVVDGKIVPDTLK